jgi:hypothetical protein
MELVERDACMDASQGCEAVAEPEWASAAQRRSLSRRLTESPWAAAWVYVAERDQSFAFFARR